MTLKSRRRPGSAWTRRPAGRVQTGKSRRTPTIWRSACPEATLTHPGGESTSQVPSGEPQSPDDQRGSAHDVDRRRPRGNLRRFSQPVMSLPSSSTSRSAGSSASDLKTSRECGSRSRPGLCPLVATVVAGCGRGRCARASSGRRPGPRLRRACGEVRGISERHTQNLTCCPGSSP